MSTLLINEQPVLEEVTKTEILSVLRELSRKIREGETEGFIDDLDVNTMSWEIVADGADEEEGYEEDADDYDD